MSKKKDSGGSKDKIGTDPVLRDKFSKTQKTTIRVKSTSNKGKRK